MASLYALEISEKCRFSGTKYCLAIERSYSHAIELVMHLSTVMDKKHASTDSVTVL